MSSSSDLGSNDSERSVDSINSDVDSDGNCLNLINDGKIVKASPDLLSILEKKLKQQHKEDQDNNSIEEDSNSSDCDSNSDYTSDSNSSGSYISKESNSSIDSPKRFKRRLSTYSDDEEEGEEEEEEEEKKVKKRQKVIHSPTPESLTAHTPLSLSLSNYDNHCILLSTIQTQTEGHNNIIDLSSQP
nr:ORF76 [Acipenserid herpesvirus 1]